jgi:hypothetical protein
MKLSLLIEAVQDLIDEISRQSNLNSNDVIKLINKCTNNSQHRKFILRQWYKNNISLPDDIDKVKSVLATFIKMNAKLSNKNILSYKSFDDIINTLDRYAHVKPAEHSSITNLPGVNVNGQNGPHICLVIRDSNSLAQLGEGTRWCTRKSHGENYADDYIDEFGWVGQIWTGNKPAIQFTSDYSESVDVNDEPATLEYFKNIIPYISPNNPPEVLCNFMSKIIKGRWPEAEKVLIKYPKWIYVICRDVIHGRWPEAEPVIIKDPRFACLYACNILRQRWKEAEPIIKRNNDAWREYVYYHKSN